LPRFKRRVRNIKNEEINMELKRLTNNMIYVKLTTGEKIKLTTGGKNGS